MRKILNGLVLAAAFSSSVASAQVVLGPGTQTGEAGQTVNFDFAISGPSAANTAVARFRLAIPADGPIEPVFSSGNTIDCSVASDLASHVITGPVTFSTSSNNPRAVVGFGDLAAPIEAFGRGGVILTCKFRIKDSTAAGSYPLNCTQGADASDPNGVAIAATCENGTLTVTGGGGAPTVTPTVTTGAVVPTATPTVPTGTQVILGPGVHSFPASAKGTVVELPFAIEGSNAAATAVARFRLGIPAESPIEPVFTSGNTVDCTVAADLASHVITGPVTFSTSGNNPRVIVGFGDLAAPIEAFGRDGVILTCKFTVKEGIANGSYTLPCAGAADSSDATGGAFTTACRPGSIDIGVDGGEVPTITPTTAPVPPTTTPTVVVPTTTPTTVVTVPTTTPTVRPPTASPTRTATGSPVPTGQREDEDGCQISTSASSDATWLLLASALGLVVVRRKRR